MAFTFGLGSDTMLSQYQRDAAQSKLLDISGNIGKYNNAVGTASGYVDYTPGHVNRFMQQDQENDNNTTFLFEYQALLRARMQQMITDLTAALTRDLDKAMSTTREVWNTDATLGPRQSAQGYTSDVEDAGAGRMAYNFFTGFAGTGAGAAAGVTAAANGIAGVAYRGIPTYESRPNSSANSKPLKVSPDTSIDAMFRGVDPATGNTSDILRVAGTGTIQQSFPQDGLPEAVIDNLVISHRSDNVVYGETGGGFVAHKNAYKFTDITDPGGRYNAQNIGYLNRTIGDNAIEGQNQSGNMNDEKWDGGVAFGNGPTQTDPYYQFNNTGNVKNEFQRVLYDTIFELDQRNLLRDVFRLSEVNSFLSDIQIASTSSINTGTQIQASIRLNFVPASADRVDLGGRIQIVIDRFSAFYHS